MIALKVNRPPSGNFAINRDSWQARGLLAWWPLAGNIHEYVRNYPMGTLNGNAALGTTDQGRALMSPAATDYLGTGSMVAQTPSYLTVCCWALTYTLAGGGNNLRTFLTNEAINSGFTFRLSTADNKIYFYVYSGAYRVAVSTFAISVNTWYHLAAIYNVAEAGASQLKLYIDGRYNAQGASAGGAIAASGAAVTIGTSPHNTTRGWSGALQDVRVYDRALSAAEIYRLWAPSTRYDLILQPPAFTRYEAPGGAIAQMATVPWGSVGQLASVAEASIAQVAGVEAN